MHHISLVNCSRNAQALLYECGAIVQCFDELNLLNRNNLRAPRKIFHGAFFMQKLHEIGSMNLLKNQYIQSLRKEKSSTRKSILGIQKEAAQSESFSQLLNFILQNPQNISQSEIDALLVSIERPSLSSAQSSMLKPAC